MVTAVQGADRTRFLLERLQSEARILGCGSNRPINTAYCNSIPVEQEPLFPGDPEMERRIRVLVRWNAMAMVVRAGRLDPDLGGHIGSFASSATLYDVLLNHFLRAPSADHGGDIALFQGHTSPGMYARSFLEGRFTEDQIINFRQEVDGKGLSSYPHPWLMPDYWQIPTVSMGLGPLQAIYLARFMKYRQARGFEPHSDRKIWCFCGDGEMDEPESLGAIGVAARERLDNLIFVVNCNLQRLDGPVRGNGKIIQELESTFLSVGWNVQKVIWGRGWDPLLQQDSDGLLLKRMEEAVDGDYQNCKAKGGAWTREHFFGKYPALAARVQHMSDHDIYHRLERGGHDPQKVYAAYHQAVNQTGQPTVILAKTVKGYGLGEAAEAQNTAHNTKKLSTDSIRSFRDRFDIPIPDSQLEEVPFYRPPADSDEIRYLLERRQALGGAVPQRRRQAVEKFKAPALQDAFAPLLKSTDEREISTTMAFVRLLTGLTKDKTLGKRIVPIVPDEARTFGMEGLFRQLGIYSPEGQIYEPVDKDQVMFYKEAKNGQILQEGINEAGAFCSWMAAGSSYSHSNQVFIPFYIYYSMFGFQRIGDLAWAAGDMRTRGFLIGGTSGRTTLNGEGLQHEDGHSHILANTIPNCVTYDPTYAYELAVIIQHGLKRMVEDEEDVFFYITTMNENYTHPEMPKGAEEGIVKGLYPLQVMKPKNAAASVQLLGSGSILREVIAAAEMLAKDYQVKAHVWSAPSFNQLARDGQAVDRENMLNPAKTPKECFVTQQLKNTDGPVVATTDYMKSYAEQIRPYIPGTYAVLGTDGFGRSDSRAKLRAHFEVDRFHIAYRAMLALHHDGIVDEKTVLDAYSRYGMSADKPEPMTS